jgi:hypothetical protein
MIFSTKGNVKQGSTPIMIGNITVEWTNTVTYLGVKFDRIMSWRSQFDYMTSRLGERMCVLRKLCCRESGITPKVAICIYKSFIRPSFDVGCPAFVTLQKYQLDRLQILQNQALRLCLRAPRDTKLTDLHREANVEFVIDHLKRRTVDFVVKAIDNYTLSGEEARFCLENFSAEELSKTPLGIVRNLLGNSVSLNMNNSLD